MKPTACFGLTAYDEKIGATNLFNQADEMLYEAKLIRNAIRTSQRTTASPDKRFRVFSQEDIKQGPN